MRILRKRSTGAVVTPADDDTFTFVVSTSDPDRDHDVLPVDNWDLENFRRNGVCAWAHDLTQPPIGTWTSLWKAGRSLMGRLKFASTEFAQTIKALVQGGFIQTASVSFRPIGGSERNSYGGLTYGQMELLEISLVPVPSNPHALLQAKAQGINVALVSKYFEPQEDIVVEITEQKGFVECPGPENNRGTQNCPHIAGSARCSAGSACGMIPLVLGSILSQWPDNALAHGEQPTLDGSAPADGPQAQPVSWNHDILQPPKGYQSYTEAYHQCKTDAQRRRLAEQHEQANRKMGVGPVGAS